ncbi:hybrid sensor histidine kinase/response regulator [Pseudomonas asuensis]|uniref:histidine kinase n=1 Tax=Pseudomonas asuensis TaxID=1825787 RepID=A0ABQ2GVM3_9PSED|nr:histidine kinase famiy protein [Pseudomonas asuensis]GGM14066.1 hybrid sensor histidine kinase/response regulator [Pseudomonas asuensis]
MVLGKNDSEREQAITIESDEQSAGVPASGELEGNAYNPLGNAGINHWQASYVTHASLDERNNIFFAAVQMTRMPMVVCDPNQPDTPIVFANKAFLDLTQYTEEETLGRNCRFLQGEQTDQNTIAEIRTALKENRAVAVDILNYKADGTPFWNALFMGPVSDQNGKLLYWFASQMDITERRLTENSFRQAQKMEAIGQLTAGLAHDFNNLLQIITGNLELAGQYAHAHPTLSQAIANAQQAAERGGKLTQQLLAFARKQRLEPKRINLNSLIVDFSEMLVRTLGESVDLRLDLKPGLPSCTLDPTHMEMALLNVLINARDAMPGGGKVTVATALMNDSERSGVHQLPPGAYVVICIIDEGVGMTPEVARRATEPFFTTKMPGTGLGLAMVHGFVQQSNGRLEIDSHLDKGTAVRMIFPVTLERAGASLHNVPTSKPDAQTILLVEDSDDVRQVTEKYLRSQGYIVLSTHSGEEALQLLDQHKKVDLLFTDIIMPGGMNGLVLADRVKQRIPDIPVLLATGYTEELANQNVNTSLCILNKPYRGHELTERINALLKPDKASF